jgi:hypothetical protein
MVTATATTATQSEPRTQAGGPRRYEAKKQKRRPRCAIPGCLNPAQSVDSPHCAFHQPMWLRLFDELFWIRASS